MGRNFEVQEGEEVERKRGARGKTERGQFKARGWLAEGIWRRRKADKGENNEGKRRERVGGGGAGEERREKGKRHCRMAFERTFGAFRANVTGLGKKDGDFWKGIEKWDVVVMSETWEEEKGWGKVKRKLPREFN